METTEQTTNQARPTPDSQPQPLSPSQSLSAEPTPVKKMPWIIIITIAILLTGLAGYFGYQNYQLRRELADQQPLPSSMAVSSPVPIVPSTPPVDPTTDWETYTNTKYSYSFNYPQQYNIRNNNAEGYDNNIATSAQLDVFNSDAEPTLVVAVTTEQTNQDFDTYANNLFSTISTFEFPQSDKDYKNPLGSIEDNSVVTPIKNEVFNGINARTFTIKGNFIGTVGLPTKSPLTTKYVLFNSNSMIYIVKLLNPTSDTESLINTFEFTN